MIKKITNEITILCGINSIARKKSSFLPRMIMYHGFCKTDRDDLRGMPIDQFRKQLIYIKKHFSPLKVSELVLERNSKGFYPDNTVAVTIDDGYENFYHLALPVLEELGIPATVFATADLTEKNGWIWPDKFHYLCLKGAYNGIDPEKAGSLLEGLKKLPVDQRDSRLKEVADKYNIEIPSHPPPITRLMSWEQLSDLAHNELIEIGSHTCTHPILANLNHEDSWDEIYRSKCTISEKLNIEVTSFCYPNGQLGDYRSDQKKMLKQAGYLCGIASHYGYITNHSDIYALPRLACGLQNIHRFRKRIDGMEYLQNKIFSWYLSTWLCRKPK